MTKVLLIGGHGAGKSIANALAIAGHAVKEAVARGVVEVDTEQRTIIYVDEMVGEKLARFKEWFLERGFVLKPYESERGPWDQLPKEQILADVHNLMVDADLACTPKRIGYVVKQATGLERSAPTARKQAQWQGEVRSRNGKRWKR